DVAPRDRDQVTDHHVLEVPGVGQGEQDVPADQRGQEGFTQGHGRQGCRQAEQDAEGDCHRHGQGTGGVGAVSFAFVLPITVYVPDVVEQVGTARCHAEQCEDRQAREQYGDVEENTGGGGRG